MVEIIVENLTEEEFGKLEKMKGEKEWRDFFFRILDQWEEVKQKNSELESIISKQDPTRGTDNEISRLDKDQSEDLRRKSIAKKVKGSRISKNQRKILEILEKYDQLTAKDIAEILWARDIRYKTPEYSSVHRSLTTLYKKGLVEKIGGQLKWRRPNQSK